MLGYAARNAVLPSLSGFAISLGFVVSGSIVMEQVFNYPGIGNVLFQAVSNDDYPLMQGIFLVITLTVLAANLIVDLLYGLIDPRTRIAVAMAAVVTAAAAGPPRPRSGWPGRLRGALRSRRLLLGLAIVGFFALLAIIGPYWSPAPPRSAGRSGQPPSAAHWLGTTQLGQDVFAQVVVSARDTLAIGAGGRPDRHRHRRW